METPGEFRRVIVVGAGIAGLSAACTLLENGVEDVLVLEAQDGPGGRICTVQASGDVIELGAQWVHGEENNPIFDLCKQHDLVDLASLSHEAEGEYRTSDGRLVDPDLVGKAKKVIESAYEECTKFTRLEKECWGEEIPTSVEEFFMKEFFKVFDAQDPLHRGLFGWLMLLEKCENACDNMAEMSPASWGEWQFCEGEWKINLKHGYKTVIDALVGKLTSTKQMAQINGAQQHGSRILLNEPVTKINWLPQAKDLSAIKPGKLAVVTSATGKAFAASHVIVTASLGFLKENLEHFFSPPLPEKVNRAIKSIGYGVIDKVFLEFSEPYWKDDFKGIQMIWTDLEQEKTSSNVTNQSWVRAITGFDPVIKQPNMLLCWIGGEEARHMEELSDQEVLYALWKLLQRFSGDKDVPQPIAVHRSSWWSNPYFRGSFSYRNLSSDVAGAKATDLGEPAFCVDTQDRSVKVPVVMLAGEAQNYNHYTTVHGAYSSGKDVANYLLKIVKI